MCTRVLWKNGDTSVVSGRNMDYPVDLATNLWKLPRGAERDDAASGGLTWTSKYGSVIAAGYDIASVDRSTTVPTTPS